MTMTAATSTHQFSLGSSKPHITDRGGNRIDAKANVFPALKGMAISLATIDSKGYREPHWHPNANELSYCLEGRALMTIFSPGANHDTFIIEPGDIAFVPMGAIHHIQNIGSTSLRMLVCFDNEQAEDLELSSSVGITPDSILGSTFSLEPAFFSKFKKSITPNYFGISEETPPLSLSYATNRYKLSLEAFNPQIHTPGGTVKISNGFYLPTLEGLAVYSLFLAPHAVREPHWHPNAAELNYLISGTVHIKLLSPDGHLDSFDMVPGDISFMPRGYYHYIENTSHEDVRMAIFFNNTFPSDIGLSGCLGAYSNQLLASLFKVKVSDLDSLPKYQQDLLVVAGGG